MKRLFTLQLQVLTERPLPLGLWRQKHNMAEHAAQQHRGHHHYHACLDAAHMETIHHLNSNMTSLHVLCLYGLHTALAFASIAIRNVFGFVSVLLANEKNKIGTQTKLSSAFSWMYEHSFLYLHFPGFSTFGCCHILFFYFFRSVSVTCILRISTFVCKYSSAHVLAIIAAAVV